MNEQILNEYVKREVFSPSEINNIIEKEAGELAHYIIENNIHEIVVIVVLEGAKYFADQLIDKLKIIIKYANSNFDLDIIKDEIKIKSYSGTNSNELSLLSDIKNDVSGKFVLIIEDIIDSGKTMSFLVNHLLLKNPKKIKIASMCLRNSTKLNQYYKKVSGELFIGFFTTSDDWFIGCGLDFNGKFRELPGIYALKDKYKN